MTEIPFAYKRLEKDLNKLVNQSFKLTEKQQFIFPKKQRTSSCIFNYHNHWAKQVWASLRHTFPNPPTLSLQREQGKAWKHNPLKGFICVSQRRRRVLKLTEGRSSSTSWAFVPSVHIYPMSMTTWPWKTTHSHAGTPLCISEQN